MDLIVDCHCHNLIFYLIFLTFSKKSKKYIDIFMRLLTFLVSFQKKIKNLLLTHSIFNAVISKSLINISNQVNFNVAFFKKKSKTKNIWIRRPKCRNKMRYQRDFWLLGHKIWLEAKQLGGKEQIILPIIVMESHTQRRRALPKKKKNKNKKNHYTSHSLPHTSKPHLYNN
jgi:hypothetical protein